MHGSEEARDTGQLRSKKKETASILSRGSVGLWAMRTQGGLLVPSQTNFPLGAGGRVTSQDCVPLGWSLPLFLPLQRKSLVVPKLGRALEHLGSF